MDGVVWSSVSDEYGVAGVYCWVWISQNMSPNAVTDLQDATELQRLDVQPKKYNNQGKIFCIFSPKN